MRAGQLGLDVPDGLAESVGATETDLEDLYRLLAIAKYTSGTYPARPRRGRRAADGPARATVLRPARRPDSFHPPGGEPFRDGDGRLHLDLSPGSGHDH